MAEELKQEKPEAQSELRHLVRIANADLDGKKPIGYALKKVKGVGITFTNAILKVLKMNPAQKVGYLSDQEIKNIEEAIRNPSKYPMPSWLFNRQKDPETGKNLHLNGTELLLAQDGDIKIMKKIKSYKGIRHILGQPVRGQRTRSHFRKNKIAAIGAKKPAKPGMPAPSPAQGAKK